MTSPNSIIKAIIIAGVALLFVAGLSLWIFIYYFVFILFKKYLSLLAYEIQNSNPTTILVALLIIIVWATWPERKKEKDKQNSDCGP